MNPFYDLPDDGLLEAGDEVTKRLTRAGIQLDTPAVVITWAQIAEEIAMTVAEAGFDTDSLEDSQLAGMAREAQKAFENDTILIWRIIVREKVQSLLGIPDDFPLPDFEDDEGPLAEEYENATRLGDADYYWVDGGESAEFFDDF